MVLLERPIRTSSTPRPRYPEISRAGVNVDLHALRGRANIDVPIVHDIQTTFDPVGQLATGSDGRDTDRSERQGLCMLRLDVERFIELELDSLNNSIALAAVRECCSEERSRDGIHLVVDCV